MIHLLERRNEIGKQSCSSIGGIRLLYKMIAVALIPMLLQANLLSQTGHQDLQTPAKMQEIARKAQEKDKTVKVTLLTTIDNQRKLSGKVSDISDTGFTLTDQKTLRTMHVAFTDVQEVKQKGMSRTAKILIVSGIVVGVVVGLGFALACSSEGGPNC